MYTALYNHKPVLSIQNYIQTNPTVHSLYAISFTAEELQYLTISYADNLTYSFLIVCSAGRRYLNGEGAMLQAGESRVCDLMR
jgi:pyruvate dehydrogenase complex dehydrogenase (E1) component